MTRVITFAQIRDDHFAVHPADRHKPTFTAWVEHGDCSMTKVKCRVDGMDCPACGGLCQELHETDRGLCCPLHTQLSYWSTIEANRS